MMESRAVRRFFRYLNKYFMVPVFRSGLGPFMGNPFTGYIMVIKSVGHRTGLLRYAPVNYAILNGNIYCLAGVGKATHWYRNLVAKPKVELVLPSGPVAGVAEEVTDPEERPIILRQILKNSGFAGFSLGFNPHTAPDEVLRAQAEGLPIMCIRPTGIGSGASDPGGWLWLLSVLASAWLLFRSWRRDR